MLRPMACPSREGNRPFEDGAEVEGCLEPRGLGQAGRTLPRSLRRECGPGTPGLCRRRERTMLFSASRRAS